METPNVTFNTCFILMHSLRVPLYPFVYKLHFFSLFFPFSKHSPLGGISRELLWFPDYFLISLYLLHHSYRFSHSFHERSAHVKIRFPPTTAPSILTLSFKYCAMKFSLKSEFPFSISLVHFPLLESLQNCHHINLFPDKTKIHLNSHPSSHLAVLRMSCSWLP